MVKRIVPHNVRLHVYDGQQLRRTASGVVIGADVTSRGSYSFVLTNAHVLHGAPPAQTSVRVLVEVAGEEGEYAAEPVAVGEVPSLDLALLRVRGAYLPAASLADEAELELGDEVVVAAAPFGRAVSISGGLISQLELDSKTRRQRVLKTDAPIGYGASGGGIYSVETGRLLGIVEGYRTAKVGFAVADQPYSFEVPMPGETFAVPVGRVKDFLRARGYGRLISSESTSRAARP